MNSKFNFNVNHFPNKGFLLAQVPSDILAEIKTEIEEISADRESHATANKTLVGQIANEYDLVKSKSAFESFLLNLAVQYENHFSGYMMDRCGIFTPKLDNADHKPLELGSYWVNFQKKHEYNPPHSHIGVFSFALWIKIPYNLKDELSLPNAKYSNNPQNSLFYFEYTDALGKIDPYYIHVDKNFEGTLAFFPSELKHGVNPFYTTDEERISVSGNLFLKD
jgi:hypothetical protein